MVKKTQHECCFMSSSSRSSLCPFESMLLLKCTCSIEQIVCEGVQMLPLFVDSYSFAKRSTIEIWNFIDKVHRGRRGQMILFVSVYIEFCRDVILTYTCCHILSNETFIMPLFTRHVYLLIDVTCMYLVIGSFSTILSIQWPHIVWSLYHLI